VPPAEYAVVRSCEPPDTWCQPPNKQLQRTVTRRRGDGASARFHHALAPRIARQRAAAQLRRYAAGTRSLSVADSC